MGNIIYIVTVHVYVTLKVSWLARYKISRKIHIDLSAAKGYIYISPTAGHLS
jgi:hypothetical protein